MAEAAAVMLSQCYRAYAIRSANCGRSPGEAVIAGHVSVPARVGKGQGAKEIGHNLAREQPKSGHNFVRERHIIGHSLEHE